MNAAGVRYVNDDRARTTTGKDPVPEADPRGPRPSHADRSGPSRRRFSPRLAGMGGRRVQAEPSPGNSDRPTGREKNLRKSGTALDEYEVASLYSSVRSHFASAKEARLKAHQNCRQLGETIVVKRLDRADWRWLTIEHVSPYHLSTV